MSLYFKVDMMNNFHIYQSYSGTLKSNLFYQLAVPMDEDLIRYDFPKIEGWSFFSKRSPTSSELLLKESSQSWLESSIYDKKILKKKQCPTDSFHITEEYFTAIKIEIHNSVEDKIILSDFNIAMDEEDQAFLVAKNFTERIALSSLIGAGFVPVTVNYSGAQNEKSIPDLYVLQFKGQNCLRPLSIQGAKNACPWCGHEPIVCQECGFKYFTCPNCHQDTWNPLEAHKGPTDKSLILSPPEQREIPIMEGSKWDGSDFVYGGGNSLIHYNFISKRALDWLLSIHAAHFCARPVQFCIDGMTDQQLEMLKKVQKPIIS